NSGPDNRRQQRGSMAKDKKDQHKAKGAAKPAGAKVGAKPTPATGKPAVVRAAKQSNQRFYAMLVLVALVGAGFIGYQMSRPKAAATTIDPNTPLPKAEGYVLGNANAPGQVI